MHHIRESVALITIDHPPVNALGISDRRKLNATLRVAIEDDSVRAIVLAGAGRGFSAGADITEMDQRSASEEPSPTGIFILIESSRKPVVAALHGMARRPKCLASLCGQPAQGRPRVASREVGENSRKS